VRPGAAQPGATPGNEREGGRSVYYEKLVQVRADLKEIQELHAKLEDVYWCFKDMGGPDEEVEESNHAAAREYVRIYEAMDEILAGGSTHF
jgi:hypothetical protein